jgi:hypothetical protein
MKKVDSDRCWFCNTGERQSRFHLVARCPAWAGQARVMWKRIRRLCEKRGPVTPSVRVMFGDSRATPCGPDLLEGHEGGKDGFVGSSGGELGGGGGQRERGRGGRAGPALECTFSFFLCLSLRSDLIDFVLSGQYELLYTCSPGYAHGALLRWAIQRRAAPVRPNYICRSYIRTPHPRDSMSFLCLKVELPVGALHGGGERRAILECL